MRRPGLCNAAGMRRIAVTVRVVAGVDFEVTQRLLLERLEFAELPGQQELLSVVVAEPEEIAAACRHVLHPEVTLSCRPNGGLLCPICSWGNPGDAEGFESLLARSSSSTIAEWRNRAGTGAALAALTSTCGTPAAS